MRAKPIPMEEQYKLVLECRQSGLSDYHWCLVYITMKMYPCSGGTDTVSPGL